MLNQGLDQQLRYAAAAGAQYQQPNFQTLGVAMRWAACPDALRETHRKHAQCRRCCCLRCCCPPMLTPPPHTSLRRPIRIAMQVVCSRACRVSAQLVAGALSQALRPPTLPLRLKQ